MPVPRWLVVAVAATSAGGCGAAGMEPLRPGAAAQRAESDPHPPRTADERLLATRYRAFVRALERHRARGICRQLDPQLADRYLCGAGRQLQIPRELERLEVPLTEVLAATDPAVPDQIQISAPTRRRDGVRLILFYRRSHGGEWRVAKTMLGWYG